MSARRPGPGPPPVLNWRHPGHWDYDRPLPCRYCTGTTHLRDSKGRPSHKVCAESALAQQAADTAAAYQKGTIR